MKGIVTIKFTRLPYRVQNNIRDEMTTFFELYLVPDRPCDNFSIDTESMAYKKGLDSVIEMRFVFKGEKEDEEVIKDYISNNLIRYANKVASPYVRENGSIDPSDVCIYVNRKLGTSGTNFSCIFNIDWRRW